MSHLFFEPSKIKRIALYLESIAKEECQIAWADYLLHEDNPDRLWQTAVQVAHYQGYNEASLAAVFYTKPLGRPKEHFSWRLVPSRGNVYRQFLQKYESKVELLGLVNSIVLQLSQPNPDYSEIKEFIKEIQQANARPGDPLYMVNRVGVELLFAQWLVSSIGPILRTIHAACMMIYGIIHVPDYVKGNFSYLGGPTFFVDALLYGMTSLCKALSYIMLPLNMLYSERMTGSYHPFNSRVENCLESINKACDEAISKSKVWDEAWGFGYRIPPV